MSADDLRALWARGRFVWGASDCMMSVWSYVQTATGIDPGAQWRGTYHDADGAQAICDAYGGAFGVFAYAMEQAGFDRADRAPMRPVMCDVQGILVAGVDLGRRVAFMAEGRGMIEMPAKVIGAWEI
ncbi:DUF6950 family protein [Oceaniglobus ichthyenteri]|uniref:DUF6950 family protein n=1 Tax=Oceaniglobus ichthyenteri TaxID=2136177 RepID=UPI000D3CB32D|nr:hypothetical protein [Oceaniglobus ichthyenteri]